MPAGTDPRATAAALTAHASYVLFGVHPAAAAHRQIIEAIDAVYSGTTDPATPATQTRRLGRQ